MDLKENLLTLSDCAEILGLNYETIRLYVNQGIAVGSRVVKLSAVRVGKRTYRTSRAALEEFISLINPDRPEQKQRRQKELEAAEKRRREVLARHGL